MSINDDVTIIIKTFLRPKICQHSINYIRKYYPTIKIYVADDSREPHQFKYIDQYYYLGFDKGVSYGRNFLIDRVKTKYFFLMDDDMEFTNHTYLEYLINMLEKYPIDVIGCRQKFLKEDGSVELFYPNKIIIKDNILYTIANEPSGYYNDIPLYNGMSFCFLANTKVFKEKGIKWDEELKLGEHVDFFYRAIGKIKLTYTPCVHVHDRHDIYLEERRGEYQKYRSRHGDFRQQAIEKKNLSNMKHIRNLLTTPKLPFSLDSFLEDKIKEMAVDKQCIFGLGTGRCGTKSLAQLLNNQDNTICVHEGRFFSPFFKDKLFKDDKVALRLPWDSKNPNLLKRVLMTMLNTNKKYVGDVAFYYLPYVETLLSLLPHVKFIALKREKEKMIESFMKKTRHNLWSDLYKPSKGDVVKEYRDWAPLMPKYPYADRRKCLDIYWEKYYEEVDRLVNKYPDQMRVYQMEELLNDANKITELLDWLGYQKKIIDIVHLNKS